MRQIPLDFAVPWNFSSEEIFLAEKWIKQQLEQHPGSDEIKAASHILTDIANEYRHQTGEDQEETNQELAQKSQEELVAIARNLVEKGHFRLYIKGDEPKEWLITAIKNMDGLIEGQI